MRVYQIKMSDLTNKKAAVEDGEGDEGGSRYSAGDAVWYQSDKEIGWWPCLVLQVSEAGGVELRSFGDNYEYGFVEEKNGNILPFSSSNCGTFIQDQLKKFKRRRFGETLRDFITAVKEAHHQSPSFEMDPEISANLDQLSPSSMTTPPPASQTNFPALDNSDIFTPSSCSRRVETPVAMTTTSSTGTRRSQRRRGTPTWCSVERPKTDFLVRVQSTESRKRRRRSESPQNEGLFSSRNGGSECGDSIEEKEEEEGVGEDSEFPIPIRRKLDMEDEESSMTNTTSSSASTEDEVVRDILSVCEEGGGEGGGGGGRRGTKFVGSVRINEFATMEEATNERGQEVIEDIATGGILTESESADNTTTESEEELVLNSRGSGKIGMVVGEVSESEETMNNTTESEDYRAASEEVENEGRTENWDRGDSGRLYNRSQDDTSDTADTVDTADTGDTINTPDAIYTADTVDTGDTPDAIDTADTVDTGDTTNKIEEKGDVRAWAGFKENGHLSSELSDPHCDSSVPMDTPRDSTRDSLTDREEEEERWRRQEDGEGVKRKLVDEGGGGKEMHRERVRVGEEEEEEEEEDREKKEEEEEEEEEEESESSEDDDLPVFQMNNTTKITVNDLREGDHIWLKYTTFPHWPALVVEAFPAKRLKNARARIVYFGDDKDYAPVTIRHKQSKKLARYVCGTSQYEEFIKAGRECGKHAEYFLRSVKEAESFIGARCNNELTGSPLERFKQICERRPAAMAPPISWTSCRLNIPNASSTERPTVSAFGVPLHHELMADDEEEEDEEDEEEEEEDEDPSHSQYTLNNVLNHITTLKPVLIGISKGTVPSYYHQLYISDLAKERQKLKLCRKFGPCQRWSADNKLTLIDHLQKMMMVTVDSCSGNVVSPTSSMFTYAGDVLLPEAMIRTISRFEGISEEEAKSQL